MADDEGGAPAASPAPRWGLREAVAGLVVAFLASAIAAAAWAGATGQQTLGELSLAGLALFQAVLWLGYLGVPLLASRNLGAGRLSVDFGFVIRARDAIVGVPVGLACQLLVVPLIYAPFHVKDLDKQAREIADKAHGPSFAVFVLVIVVGAPVIEELFFRGLLLRALARRFGDGWAVAASALVFAGAHFEGVQFAGLAVVGAVFAVLAVRSGRLGPSIFAHAAFNAVVAVSLFGKR